MTKHRQQSTKVKIKETDLRWSQICSSLSQYLVDSQAHSVPPFVISQISGKYQISVIRQISLRAIFIIFYIHVCHIPEYLSAGIFKNMCITCMYIQRQSK